MTNRTNLYADKRNPPKFSDTAVGNIIANRKQATGTGTPNTVLDFVRANVIAYISTRRQITPGRST
ncbi:hypothetical protein NBRC116597_25820 [Phaeobacter sp. NW0010-22]